MATPPLPACAEVPPTVLASASSSPAEPVPTTANGNNKKRYIGEVTKGEEGEITVTFSPAPSTEPAKKQAATESNNVHSLKDLADYADAVTFKVDTLVERLNAIAARDDKEALELNKLRAAFIVTLSETATLIAQQMISDADVHLARVHL